MADDLPSRSTERDGARSRSVAILIAGWSLVALVALVASVVGAPPTGLTVAPWIVGLLGVLAFVAGVVHVRVVLRGATEAVTLNEVGVIPVVLLLPPGAAVLVGAAAGFLAEVVVTRGQMRKVLFNAAWHVVGLASSAWVFRLLAPEGFAVELRPLLASLVAAAVYVAVNLLAIAGIVAIRSRRSWRVVLAEEAPSSVTLGYAAAQAGIIAAVLLVEAPLALPLLVLPVLLYRGRARARSEGLEAMAAERDRFERTVAGTTDGVVLVGPDGRAEVWNPAMARLSGIAASQALGRTLQELGWQDLRRSDHDEGEPVLVTLQDRSLSVRSSSSGERGSDARTVLVVRDVTREAELARLQDELVTRVSHEIRTPLTTVMGLLETLERHWDDLPPDRRQDLLRVAARGGRRLGRLVANLESLARIEARVAELGPVVEQSTRVDEVVDEVARSSERSFRPVLSIETTGEVFVAQEDLRVMLENLLGNAELYGAPPVSVTVRAVGDEIELRVSDHGPGIPQELRAQLFEPFSQADAGLRRTARGLGLGLAIVRSLATASGGSVELAEADDGATTFSVRLPAAEASRSGAGGVSARST